MLQLPKKNTTPPPGEGTVSELRAAARSSTSGPATLDKPKRRTFTAEYKRRILREADAALTSGEDGAVGALLRREGLYSSHLTAWRRERDAGELAGLAPRKRGRKATRSAMTDELARLQRKVERLETDLRKAETIIDVQKKLSLLLGIPLSEPTEEDLPPRRKP